jgi:hypothetical protein
MTTKPTDSGPDPEEAMARDIEGLRRLVVDSEEEKKRRGKKEIPRDLFGVVSLMPRRLMGGALVFALMVASGLGTYVWTLRTARQDDDGAALKYVTGQALPTIQTRLSLVETGLAEVRGTNERNERELKDLARALARIEGKLDRALR